MHRILPPAEVTISYTSGELIRDIARLVAPYRWRFFVASFLRLVGDLVWLYPPIALATIVTFLTTYTPGEPLTPVWVPLLLWIGALIVRGAGHFVAKYEGIKLSERVALESSLAGLRHMFRLDMLWHERENSGNKLKRVTNGSVALSQILRMWFMNVIEIVVNFVGVSLILLNVDPWVLLFLCVFAVSFFTISFAMTKRAAAASYLVNEQEEEVQGLQFEAVNNVRSVKVMGIIEPLHRMLTKSTDVLYQRIRTRVWRFQTRNGFLYIWGYGFNIGIIAFIIWGISQGRYELGLLILFHGYFGRIWESVSEFATLLQDFTTAKYSISRMQDVLDEPVTIDADEGKGPVPAGWKEIALKDVSFTYGGNAVLNDVSFTVRRGEKVGIVGLSGAGKSTLFKLLLKEREEYTGEITVDEVPLKDIRRSDYFMHVSAVLQDTEVFNLSLKDNIVIARGDDDEDALARAIDIAHVRDFIPKLAHGLDTLIGEKGVKLSGGERQRLGIARAIYKEPELLLLDEATSHLDLESEEKIRDSLASFFKNVTAIVIAHRLTTIREMDKILVMEKGSIIESGSYDELMEKKGRFHELWEKQKL